ncbi:hypothetical protein BH11BAC7_BH11BAC7_00600 [soil metagenome]
MVIVNSSSFLPVYLRELKTALTKFRLDIEYDYDFFLAGISCHEKPYRLCWAINRAIGHDMAQTEPLSIALKKTEAPSDFPVFKIFNKENDTSIFLIANKTETTGAEEQPGIGLLIPEQNQADYFFIVKGPFNEHDLDQMMKSIREIPFVQLIYRINPSVLKSKENLLF